MTIRLLSNSYASGLHLASESSGEYPRLPVPSAIRKWCVWNSAGANRRRTVRARYRKPLGGTGLMSFVPLTTATSCGKATGRNKTEMTHLVIGNLLMMREVAKHVPGAGSYAPVNAIRHGTIDTPGLKDLLASGDAGEERRNMVARAIPLGRVGRPDEVAKAVGVRASDESNYITGSESFVDGGFAQV